MPNGPEPAVALYWFEALDPTIAPGVVAPMYQLLVRTDTSPSRLYWKSGIGSTQWTLITGGSVAPGTATEFEYTVTGLEPDLSELTIPLPAARADALYLVTPSQQTATRQLAMSVADSTKTLAHFVLSLSAVATVGDVFSFLVANAY